MFRVNRSLFVAMCVLLFGCDKAIVVEYVPSDSAIVSMASLREKVSTTPSEITGDVYIEGRVVSSDDSWNIRNSIYITDLTATVEVRIDEKYLYKRFPCGSKIRVSCNSLNMYLSNGVTCIGLEREKYWVTSIPNDKISVYLESVSAPLEIVCLNKTIDELDVSSLGYFVQISDVQFQASDIGCYWTSGDVVTKRVLVDASGDSLVVRTLPTASFALFRLPIGSGSIGGVLTSDDDEYQLIVTNYKKVKMNNGRF